MTIVEALKGLLARVKASGWGDETNREAYEALTPEEKREYRRLERSDYFVPENAQLDRRQEHVSPSGKYKLVVTPYSTKAGSWNYTQGLVYAIGSDTPIAEVQRNYSNFFFEFVEDHPNDHAYLVCGEDYQGQTVIELDTGRRRDFLPKEADDGVGFCWAQYTFDKATQILVVDGCYWACPYEYRFFDFSDPMAGWPEIESEVMIDVDAKPPTIEPDGTIKAYLTHNDEDSDEEVPVEKRELASTMTSGSRSPRRNGEPSGPKPSASTTSGRPTSGPTIRCTSLSSRARRTRCSLPSRTSGPALRTKIGARTSTQKNGAGARTS
jgi:hypothetical protein